MDTNIISLMIWHCQCSTVNSKRVKTCVVCDRPYAYGEIVEETDTEILDIQLETIYWYMKAEVENRLHNLQIMSLNDFTIE